jgi:hypothetical protein
VRGNFIVCGNFIAHGNFIAAIPTPKPRCAKNDFQEKFSKKNNLTELYKHCIYDHTQKQIGHPAFCDRMEK